MKKNPLVRDFGRGQVFKHEHRRFLFIFRYIFSCFVVEKSQNFFGGTVKKIHCPPPVGGGQWPADSDSGATVRGGDSRHCQGVPADPLLPVGGGQQ